MIAFAAATGAAVTDVTTALTADVTAIATAVVTAVFTAVATAVVAVILLFTAGFIFNRRRLFLQFDAGSSFHSLTRIYKNDKKC